MPSRRADADSSIAPINKPTIHSNSCKVFCPLTVPELIRSDEQDKIVTSSASDLAALPNRGSQK
jgi:hypothetical protein